MKFQRQIIDLVAELCEVFIMTGLYCLQGGNPFVERGDPVRKVCGHHGSSSIKKTALAGGQCGVRAWWSATDFLNFMAFISIIQKEEGRFLQVRMEMELSGDSPLFFWRIMDKRRAEGTKGRLVAACQQAQGQPCQ